MAALRYLRPAFLLLSALALSAQAGLHAKKLDPGYSLPPGIVNDAFPEPEQRDQWLAAAGLKDAVEGWDALDRDVLVLRARSLSLETLTQRYPNLNRTALGQLQVVIRDAR